MGPCHTCGRTVAFGGVKELGFRFCSKPCHARKAGFLKQLATVSEASAAAEAERMRAGLCPRCGEKGGVDIHRSVLVWSAIIITKTQENVFVGCTGCARKRQFGDTLGTALFGWWGIPFGLIMTPLGVVMNIAQMISSSRITRPSKQLTNIARENLARAAAGR